MNEKKPFIDVLKMAIVKISEFPRNTSAVNLILVCDYTDQHFHQKWWSSYMMAV